MFRLFLGNLFLIGALIMLSYGLYHVWTDGIHAVKAWEMVTGGFFAGLIGYNILIHSDPRDN